MRTVTLYPSIVGRSAKYLERRTNFGVERVHVDDHVLASCAGFCDHLLRLVQVGSGGQ